jgi:hypothetical protein
MDEFKEHMEVQCKRVFFDLLKEDLDQDPPQTERIHVILQEIVEGLCKFVPSKQGIHETMKQDILCDDISPETMPHIIMNLIKWIERFQSINDDTITHEWRATFKQTTDYSQFIIDFLQEYYIHVEKVYKEVWEARQRLIRGENLIPPEHRVQGKNGVPFHMKTGF